MASVLVALLDDKARYPTVPAEFGVQVGWWFFAFAVVMLLWTWTRAESVRRCVLALEDPRTYAVLRIGFAIMTIICFLNLAPYWRMLWSDEGMFDMAYAQDRMGRSALRGWTPEDGFFDLWAVVCFLWNKPSFFYMYGSPDFVFWHMMALFAACTLYGFGVFSRTMGFVCWLLISSVYNRNALYWEGTDTVYRCFWLILLFAKTGHAWSFDNWWRCRRLRKQGRLEIPGEDGTAPDGRKREPIYRLVPAWPRWLCMLQLAGLYCSTGCVKTGDVWLKGDALYYALNMDHFYRFEGLTQAVSSVFATNLFRLNTWVTHWWERCFPLLIVGEILRFGLLHKDAAWMKAQSRGVRLWLGRGLLLAGYLIAYRVVVITLPFCLSMIEDTPQDPTRPLFKTHLAMGVGVPLFVAIWYALRRWPLVLLRGGRTITLPARLPRILRTLRLPQITISHESMRRWLLGRRLWLTLGFIFHGFLILFMNIGMFPFIMLMTYAAYVTGDEYARGFGRIAAWLRTRSRLARLAPPATAFIPAQAPGSVPVRGRRFPDVLVLVLGLGGAYLVWARAHKETWVGTGAKVWLASIVVIAVVLRLLRPRPRELALIQQPPALAYSAIGRALALFAFCWHTGAVGLHLFPPYAIYNTWRTPAKSVFGPWLAVSGTSQSWEMFAPNPPRSNQFMKSVVVEHDGDRWDLRNNAFEYRPSPWIINDRMRKMQRRMVGKGKWYLRYWVDFQCREWALRTGEVPKEVEIWSITTRIPPPEVVNVWQPRKFKGRRDGSGAITGQPYDPRALVVKESHVQTHQCGKSGQLPPFMKQRYGLPLLPEDEQAQKQEDARLERLHESRRKSWDNRTDFGRASESAEERKERMERQQRERKERDLEERIDEAVPVEDEPERPGDEENS